MTSKLQSTWQNLGNYAFWLFIRPMRTHSRWCTYGCGCKGMGWDWHVIYI